MAQIDDFKSNLLGGDFRRTNQFRNNYATIGIDIGLDVRRTSFYVNLLKHQKLL